MEPWHEFPFEERQLIPRETPFGKFLGSQWQAQMPDGRLLRMYRWLSSQVYEQIRQRASEPQAGERTRTRGRENSTPNRRAKKTKPSQLHGDSTRPNL